jgi:hypothetical protein
MHDSKEGEFTDVNNHFENKHNAEARLYRQTLYTAETPNNHIAFFVNKSLKIVKDLSIFRLTKGSFFCKLLSK